MKQPFTINFKQGNSKRMYAESPQDVYECLTLSERLNVVSIEDEEGNEFDDCGFEIEEEIETEE